MRPKWNSSFLLSALFLLSAASVGYAAEREVPPPPARYVYDEPHVISEVPLRALDSLLYQHYQATGEQLVIAVFNDLGGEDLVAYTNRVFTAWKIGQKERKSGVLLALYWKEHKIRIEVGYGLEPVLTDAKSRRIIEEVLVPELRAGEPGQALALGSLAILKVLDSPLIQNGRAEEILRGEGLRTHRQSRQRTSPPVSFVALLVIFVLIRIVLRIMARDAFFTGGGWYRTGAYGRRQGLSNVDSVFWGTGGGWGGGSSGGGGGGFIGGGGSSGGGGASGSW